MCYGLVILLRLLSTLPYGNAVTYVGFRAVTLPWKGLPPYCSNAFGGALAGTLRRAVRSSAFNGILGGRHMECAYYFDFCRLCLAYHRLFS